MVGHEDEDSSEGHWGKMVLGTLNMAACRCELYAFFFHSKLFKVLSNLRCFFPIRIYECFNVLSS